MLNEAFILVEALRAAGIELPSYQQGVVTPGKSTGPCLRVRLQQDSTISSIEALAEEEWAGLWTIMDGNQNSRPVVRLNIPLLRIPLEDTWWASIGYTSNRKRENVSEINRMSSLQTALDNSAWFQSFTKTVGDEAREITPAEKASKLWNRIRDRAKELSTLIDGHDDLVNVQSVFERLGNLPEMHDFAGHLRSVIKAQLNTASLPIDIIENILIGKMKYDRGMWNPSELKVQLAFDIDQGGTIYRAKTRSALEVALGAQGSEVQAKNVTQESFSRCAYRTDGPLQEGAFPNPQLPIVAEKGMPLVSMFSDAPANMRYSLKDSNIVPVSQNLASRMAKALLWVTSKERYGKTWRGVASGIFDKSREQQDLFITYVDSEPQMDATIADFFGKGRESLNKQFEVDSKAVCDSLSAIVRDRPSSKLRVFALRQVSPGQAQVVLSRTLDPQRIVEGTKLWNEGAENLPPISVPVPKDKGTAPEDRRPTAPYPNQVVRLLSRQWIREGAKKDKQEPFIPVEGPTLGSIIDLLVREPGKYESVARSLLRRDLIQVGPLLKGLADAIRTRDKKRLDQYPVVNRYEALTACSIIGLTLHALNSRKESYMKNSAFAIGKMLALADDIHRSYCTVVRDGSIPPSLLGNSLLPTAMENPTRAVAVLGDRLKIYIGWAKTAKDPPGAEKELDNKKIAIRTARKRLAQYGSFTESIADQGLPTKMDDFTKAHVLLGYLASTTETSEGEQVNE